MHVDVQAVPRQEPVDLGPRPEGRFDERTLWWRHERLHRAALRNPAKALPAFERERDEAERRWLANAPAGAAAVSRPTHCSILPDLAGGKEPELVSNLHLGLRLFHVEDEVIAAAAHDDDAFVLGLDAVNRDILAAKVADGAQADPPILERTGSPKAFCPRSPMGTEGLRAISTTSATSLKVSWRVPGQGERSRTLRPSTMDSPKR